ncbi:hypothetical protein [Cellulomonas sp. P5_C5]
MTDQIFLEWLAQAQISSNARVIGIDFVEIDSGTDGGNRGRLLRFLTLADDVDADIRGLVDADHFRLHDGGEVLPAKAWLTDHRDLESYVLAEPNLDSVLRAGCGISEPPALDIFNSMVTCARFFAAVRLASIQQGLRLPVSDGKWIRHVDTADGLCIDIRKRPAVSALLQAADHSLRLLDQLLLDIEVISAHLQTIPERDVIHGKDSMRILTKQLATLGIRVDDAGRLVRSTFAREHVAQYPTLAAIVSYLSGE